MKDVAKGVREAQVTVEYRLLRPFLVEIVREFRGTPRTLFMIEQIGLMVKKAIDHVRLQFRTSSAMAIMELKMDWRDLLETITVHLYQILDCGKSHHKLNKGGIKECRTGLNMEEITQRFATTADMETEKMCMYEAFHAIMNEMEGRDRGVLGKLEAYLEQLKVIGKEIDAGPVEDDDNANDGNGANDDGDTDMVDQ